VIDFFHHRCKFPRGLAVLLSYLFLILVILLSPLVFIPPIINGFNFLAKIDYQVLIVDTLNWAEQTLLNLKGIDTQALGFSIDLNAFIDPALALLQNTSADITPTLPSFATIINSLHSAVTITYGVATNVAGTVFSGVLAFIVMLLSAIYISLDMHRFNRRFLNVVPKPYRSEIAILLSHLRKTWRAYFRGQLNLMLIIGIITWIGNTAIGLPGAFALAVVAGVMELIPNLGPFLAAIPAIIVALLQGSTYLGVSNFVFALIVILLYLAIQQVENTFVVPRILGEAVDLHPLVVILGVVVGANVGGILGALLAAPVIASAREIIRYLYTKILGENPYPPQEEEPETAERLSWQEQAKLWWGQIQQRIAARRRLPPRPQEEPAESSLSEN
jgi:predicted PurR-regulated permease PerM